MEPKAVRETLGLNVTEMARICGIHYMTWSKWEKGKQSPPAVARRMLDLLLWLHEEGLFDKAMQDLAKEEMEGRAEPGR
jgi:DNA-binding transcriptional regulator YiaG